MIDSLRDVEPHKMRGYVVFGVGECPSCSSDQITGKEITIPNGGEIRQSVTCEVCGTWWDEVYALVDVQNISTDLQTLTR